MTPGADIATSVKRSLVAEARTSLAAVELRDDTALNAPELRLESMAFLRALLTLEEELDVAFDDELLASTTFATVGDVVQFVRASLDATGES